VFLDHQPRGADLDQTVTSHRSPVSGHRSRDDKSPKQRSLSTRRSPSPGRSERRVSRSPSYQRRRSDDSRVTQRRSPATGHRSPVTGRVHSTGASRSRTSDNQSRAAIPDRTDSSYYDRRRVPGPSGSVSRGDQDNSTRRTDDPRRQSPSVDQSSRRVQRSPPGDRRSRSPTKRYTSQRVRSRDSSRSRPTVTSDSDYRSPGRRRSRSLSPLQRRSQRYNSENDPPVYSSRESSDRRRSAPRDYSPEDRNSNRDSREYVSPSGDSTREDQFNDRLYYRESRSPSEGRSRKRRRSGSPQFRVPKVPYKKLIRQMETYLGDDLPTFSSTKRPACRSALRAPKATSDDIRPLPISDALSNAMLDAQKSIFGFDGDSISSLPPLHFVPDNNKGKAALPSFPEAYYRVQDDVLDSRASKLGADAASLWGSKPTDIKSFSFDPASFDRAESAIRRSLLALNHADWFCSGLCRADEVFLNPSSPRDEREDAILFYNRIKDSLGMCLETALCHQSHLLSVFLAQKRDSILKVHKGALHQGVMPFLRAQPVLAKRCIFGPVSQAARPLQEVARADKMASVMKDAVLGMSRSRSSFKGASSSTRGGSSRGSSSRARSGPSRSSSTFHNRQSGSSDRQPRAQSTTSKPDFTAPASRGSAQPSRGAPFRGRGGRRPAQRKY
jgi:hypothetical protein